MVFQTTTILFFGIIAFISSILINWLLLKFSINLGIRDNENLNQVRWTNKTKPSLGGFSFYFVFLFCISIVGFMNNSLDIHFNKQMIGLIISSTLGFIVGLADDTYNTNPLIKFMGQLTCAFILIVCDISIHIFDIPSLDYVITILWIIGLMNSINMLDNMDGVTASISVSVLLGIFMVGSLSEQINIVTSIVIISQIGALLGFLIYNWNPSRMYMGDTGSQFLGVFLAAISILFIWDNKSPQENNLIQFKQLIFPMLLFIVPLIDTITVTIRRMMRKQSPFVGGRDHITHHLAYNGIKDGVVSLVLFLLNSLSILIVYYLYTMDNWSNNLILSCFIYFIFLFICIQIIYNRGKQKNEANSQANLNVQS